MNCRLPTAYCSCLLLLLLPTATASAQCDPKEYTRIFSEALAFQQKGQFIEAKNRYEAVKIYACNQKERDAADLKIDALFEQIDRLRHRADSTADANRQAALTAYANDLAYKSSIALQEGHRTVAFRLAEWAFKYVDPANAHVMRALVEALYHNDLPDNKKPLAWAVWALQGGARRTAFSPDSQYLAISYDDKNIRIWDIKNQKIKSTLTAGDCDPFLIIFSPDGKRLYVQCKSNTVYALDIETGKKLFEISVTCRFIEDIKLSPDGTKLALACEVSDIKGIVKIWDLQKGAVFRAIEDRQASVRCVSFSPDNKYLAAGFGDHPVILDLESNNLRNIDGNGDRVAFSPDGKSLAFGSFTQTANILNLENNRIQYAIDGKSDLIEFSRDGKKFVTSGGPWENTVKIWDLESKKYERIPLIVQENSGIRHVAVSPDGKYLATISDERIARIWDLENNPAAVQFAHMMDVYSIVFSPDGKTLVTVSRDNLMARWDWQEKKFLTAVEAHHDKIGSVDISPDGKLLATGSADKMVNIWSFESGNLLRTLKGHASTVTRVAFVPVGNWLVTGSLDSTVRVWDPASDNAPRILKRFNAVVWCIAAAPDGKTVAIGLKDKSALLLDLATGEVLRTLAGHALGIPAIAFSSDGTRIATGSEDNTIKIWDVKTGKVIMTLTGHSQAILSVVFSPDGQRLATGSLDNTVKVWDLHTRKEILSLQRAKHDNCLSVVFSPDGKYLVAGFQSGKIMIWAIAPDDLVRQFYSGGFRAPLLRPQLQQYGLESLLDLRPDNEQKLIDTRETWQIKAFADLAAAQAAGSNILAGVEPYFARADRLYAAALALQDEPTVRQAYAAMLRRWAEVCTAEGLASRAAELINKAGGLWKE